MKTKPELIHFGYFDARASRGWSAPLLATFRLTRRCSQRGGWNSGVEPYLFTTAFRAVQLVSFTGREDQFYRARQNLCSAQLLVGSGLIPRTSV